MNCRKPSRSASKSRMSVQTTLATQSDPYEMVGEGPWNVAHSSQPSAPAWKKTESVGSDGSVETVVLLPPISVRAASYRSGSTSDRSLEPTPTVPSAGFTSTQGNH